MQKASSDKSYIESLPGALGPHKKYNTIDVNADLIALDRIFNTTYKSYASAECKAYIYGLVKSGGRNFGDSDRIYDPKIIPSIFYCPQSCDVQIRGRQTRTSHLKSLTHIGKLKLFVADLQALNELISVDDAATVLYIGAAPGNQTHLLASLYPRVKFILFDKNEFNSKLYDKPNVEIHKELFTAAHCAHYAGAVDIIISDIRMELNKQQTELEDQIHEDMLRQQSWVIAIKPRLGSMLKFRPPYLLPDLPASVPKPSEYRYLGGKIFWQIFPHIQSTEGRLLSTAADIELGPIPFDYSHYEAAALEHNIKRVWCTYNIPEEMITVNGFDRCLDCTYLYYELRRVILAKSAITGELPPKSAINGDPPKSPINGEPPKDDHELIDLIKLVVDNTKELTGGVENSPALNLQKINLHGYFQHMTRVQKHEQFIKLIGIIGM